MDVSAMSNIMSRVRNISDLDISNTGMNNTACNIHVHVHVHVAYKYCYDTLTVVIFDVHTVEYNVYTCITLHVIYMYMHM